MLPLANFQQILHHCSSVFIPVLSIFRPDLISSEWKDNDRVLDGTKTVNSFQTLCIDDIAVFGIQHDFVEQTIQNWFHNTFSVKRVYSTSSFSLPYFSHFHNELESNSTNNKKKYRKRTRKLLQSFAKNGKNLIPKATLSVNS